MLLQFKFPFGRCTLSLPHSLSYFILNRLQLAQIRFFSNAKMSSKNLLFLLLALLISCVLCRRVNGDSELDPLLDAFCDANSEKTVHGVVEVS